MSYTVKETADFLNVSDAHVQQGMKAMAITGLVDDDALGLLEGWVAENPEQQQAQPKRGRRAQQQTSTDLVGTSFAISTQVATSRQPLAGLVGKLMDQQESDAENLAAMLNPAIRTEGVVLRALQIAGSANQQPVEFDFDLPESDPIFAGQLAAVCSHYALEAGDA